MIRRLTIIAILALAIGTAAQQPQPDSQTHPEPAIVKIGKHEPGVTPPKVIKSVELSDNEMRTKGVSGGCSLVLVVDIEGIPQDVRVLQCSEPSLADASVKALTEYRFKPAMKNGVPVAAKIKFRTDMFVGHAGEEPESSPCVGPKTHHSRLAYAFRPPPGEVTSTPDANGTYTFAEPEQPPSIIRLSDEGFCLSAAFEAPTSKCNAVLTIDANGYLSDLQSPKCSIESLQGAFAASLEKAQFVAGQVAGKPVRMRVFFFLDFNDVGPKPPPPAKP